MIGTILKYSAAVAAGAVLFAAMLHNGDHDKLADIEELLRAQREALAATDMTEEDRAAAMKAYIDANRLVWESRYFLKETDVQFKALLATYA